MKRVIVFFFLTFMLLAGLSGCGSGETQDSNQNVATDNPSLAGLLEAIESAELTYASINADGALLYSDPKEVRVTKGLLRDIGNVILSGKPARLEIVGGAATNFNQNITVQFQFGDDNQYAGINLFSGTDEQPVKAMMWLQLGEELSHYTLELSAFEKIQNLVSAQTFSKELVLEGDHVRYDPIRANLITASHSGLYLEYVLEKGRKLLFRWRENDEYWLEAVNPETGEASVVWEYTSEWDWGWDTLVLEDAHYGEFDYRIKGNRMAVYRSSIDPVASQIFNAPIDDGDDRYFSFDIDPETGYTVYSTEDGVYAGYEGNMRKLLDNSDLEESDNSSLPEGYYPFYGEVHLINDSRQFAAIVIHPMSQSGRQALVLVDTETGKVTSFGNLFSAMVADVHYIGGKTVVAGAIEQVTMIDAESKQTELLPSFAMEGVTNDFKTYLFLRQEKGETGISTGFLTKYEIEVPEQEKQILKITGENAWISKVTHNYAILQCKDSREAYIAIVPLTR